MIIGFDSIREINKIYTRNVNDGNGRPTLISYRVIKEVTLDDYIIDHPDLTARSILLVKLKGDKAKFYKIEILD